MLIHKNAQLLLAISISITCSMLAMNEEGKSKYNNPYNNPTTHEEVVLNTQHQINTLHKELTRGAKPLPPKYDAVKVLREWTNDPDFSKKITQEQVGKPVDAEGLVAHKVHGTEQPAKVSNISEDHARKGREYIQQLAILSEYVALIKSQPSVSGNLFTIGANLQHGKYVAIPTNDNNVKADIQRRVAQAVNDQQRFGRGSSGKDKAAKL
jgi:hypothetical protein